MQHDALKHRSGSYFLLTCRRVDCQGQVLLGKSLLHSLQSTPLANSCNSLARLLQLVCVQALGTSQNIDGKVDGYILAYTEAAQQGLADQCGTRPELY